MCVLFQVRFVLKIKIFNRSTFENFYYYFIVATEIFHLRKSVNTFFNNRTLISNTALDFVIDAKSESRKF